MNINWKQVSTNLAGTGGSGAAILAFVPEKYQVPAAIGLAILSNLLGAIQKAAVTRNDQARNIQ